MTRLSGTDLAEYPRVLGAELRRLRQASGLTRRELIDRLPDDLSIQTLATYELGTRMISVLRLVQLCEALGTTAQELLASADGELRRQPGTVRINLRALACDTGNTLAPARRWAASRLRQLPADAASIATLDRAAVEQLARLCDVPAVALLRTLSRADLAG